MASARALPEQTAAFGVVRGSAERPLLGALPPSPKDTPMVASALTMPSMTWAFRKRKGRHALSRTVKGTREDRRNSKDEASQRAENVTVSGAVKWP